MPWIYTYWDVVWQASYDDVCLNMRMGHKSSLSGMAWRGSRRLWCRPFLGEFPWVPSGIPGCWNAIDMLNAFSRSFAFVADVPCVVATFSKAVYRTKTLFLHCDLVLADSIFMDQNRPNIWFMLSMKKSSCSWRGSLFQFIYTYKYLGLLIHPIHPRWCRISSISVTVWLRLLRFWAHCGLHWTQSRIPGIWDAKDYFYVTCVSRSRWCFQICVLMFTPYLGKWSNLTNILDGLIPPTRYVFM